MGLIGLYHLALQLIGNPKGLLSLAYATEKTRANQFPVSPSEMHEFISTFMHALCNIIYCNSQ